MNQCNAFYQGGQLFHCCLVTGTKRVKQISVVKMMNVVDVSEYSSVDQSFAVGEGICTIFCQTHLEEPVDESAAIKYLFVDLDTPSMGKNID